MKNQKITFAIGLFYLALTTVGSVNAQPVSKPVAKPVGPDSSTQPAQQPTAGEAVDVSKIQEKYWAQGKETELGVVQNRKFTLAKKVEFGLFGGVLSSDPFLSVNHYGFRLGYHFNQYISAHAIGWRTAVGPSAALKKLESSGSTTANTNNPKGFYGAEFDANLLYGKLSLLGKSIIYIDIFALGGAGMTQTESGDNFTPFVGIGQKIHMNQFLSLQIDYRIMRYNEKIRSKDPTTFGQAAGERSNNTGAVSLGLIVNF